MTWRDHELCGPAAGFPSRFWGPEKIDANAWSEFSERLRVEAEAAFLNQALGGQGRVLDVGAGSGLLTRGFATSVGYLVAAEPNPAIGAQLATTLSDRLTLVRARAEVLPFATGSFDAVVSTWVLQYTDDPGACVQEMARVCSRRRGSCVVIVQAAPNNDLVTLYNACTSAIGEPAAHHGFLLANAAEILEASGFTSVSLQRCPVQLDFRDIPLGARAKFIASIVRRLHHSAARAEAVESAVETATAALEGFESGTLCDDGVALLARAQT